MNYLHSELDIGPDDIVEATLDKQGYVRLMDNNNYYFYKNEINYDAYGGLAKVFPVHVSPPEFGHWHIVIDLGGESDTIKSTVKLVREKQFIDMVWLCTETTKEKKKEESQNIWQKLISPFKK